MRLDSLSFVFLFLPLGLAVYYLVPGRAKPLVLLALSWLFYGLLQPLYLVVMVLLVALDYGLSVAIHRHGVGSAKGRRLLAFTVGKSVLLMLSATAFSQIYGFTRPLGIYIYTLTALGYLVDLFRGEVEFEPSFVRFGVLCCFFGSLFAGPLVVEAGDVLGQLRSPKPSLSTLGDGLMIFVQGLSKKVIIADNITAVFLQLRTMASQELTVLTAWGLVFSAVFSIYFTLSSYCDMARGLGAMFCLKLPLNFYYPLQARTVNDFFSRFNFTVSDYIRKYVYGSLGRDQGGALSTSLNVLLITMMMGLWFGLRTNYLAWGAFLALFIIVETLYAQPLIQRVPPFFLRLYTFTVILFSFSLYAADSLGQAGAYFHAMLGMGGVAFQDNRVLYLFSSNWLVIVLSFFLSTSLFHMGIRRLQKYRPQLTAFVSAVANLSLLALTVALML